MFLRSLPVGLCSIVDIKAILAVCLTGLLSWGCAGSGGQRGADNAVVNETQAAQDDGLDDVAMEEICQELDCRENVQVTLYTEDGVYDRFFELFPPVVQDAGVTILPGEELFIEAMVEGDDLVDLRQVDTIVNPERTLTLKFWQEDDMSMFLVVTNPFDRPMKYHLAMMPLADEEGGLYKTSSCPVMPGVSSYEIWSQVIFQLLFMQPRLLEGDTLVGCEF